MSMVEIPGQGGYNNFKTTMISKRNKEMLSMDHAMLKIGLSAVS